LKKYIIADNLPLQRNRYNQRMHLIFHLILYFPSFPQNPESILNEAISAIFKSKFTTKQDEGRKIKGKIELNAIE